MTGSPVKLRLSSSLGFARDKSDSLQDDMQQSTGQGPPEFRSEDSGLKAGGAIYCAPTRAGGGVEVGFGMRVDGDEMPLAVQNLAEEAKIHTRYRR